MGRNKYHQQEDTIRIGEWAIRQKNRKERWKVSGPKGNFTLHQRGMTKWRYISGTSSNRSQSRRQIDAVGVEEAALKSIEILFGRSATTIMPRWDIADVLRHGWEDSNCEPYHREHLKTWTKYFLDWCLGEKIYYWEDLIETKTPMDYVESLLQRKVQRKSISHYLEPLMGASKWAANKSRGRVEDWFAGFRIPPRVGVELKYENKKPLAYLPISKILVLLDWLRGYRQGLSLRPGIALQGIVGLQLQEALRLTWDRWDRVNKTITIEEDRRHNPDTAGVKNRWRVRRLPIPDIVNETLIEIYELRECPDGSELIVQVPTWKAYCNRIYRMFKKFDSDCRIPPSDFRNTLVTIAEDGKWMSVWVRRYFGHAPSNEIERSYLAVQAAEGRDEGTDAFVEKLREEVVKHIEQEIEVALGKLNTYNVIRIKRHSA